MRFSYHMILAIFFFCSTLCCINISLAHQEFLDVHNQARKEVGVRPLTWNTTLEAYAQNYANSRIDDCAMEHSMGPYGENLAEGHGEMKDADAVKFWLTEKPFYDYDSNKCVQDECLHYTQIVWRDTVHLGCGKANCKNGWVFVICSYSPVGNIDGQRPY
ncbi:basic form of pathogenesis-related protein 1-like [Vicia villosa]|uniref:basic form of pathogenesis-related protein 1-like n=1 Tax=Vicia villosa TaxID=3911 RepID=UPI00273C06D1|nr:basic form of pathogenesis-related protein 1-like [Vicia villosa]